MDINESIKETMNGILAHIETSIEVLKKPGLSDGNKIAYALGLSNALNKRLPETFEKIYELMKEYEELKTLNTEMFQDMSWLYYDYNLAVGLLSRHVANHPNATKQDKQAADYAMINPPKEPSFPRRQK